MAARRADPLNWTSISLRIERTLLRDLKVAAVEADTTVSSLVIEGIHHVLARHRKRMARRTAREAA